MIVLKSLLKFYQRKANTTRDISNIALTSIHHHIGLHGAGETATASWIDADLISLDD